MKNKIKLSAILKIAIPLVLLIILLIVKFTVIDKKEFSLVRYAMVKVEGFEGIAKATVLVDDVGLFDAITGEDVAAEEELEYRAFVDSVEFSLDIREGLANGDTIRITAVYDEALANKLGIKVGTTKKEYKVSGLEKGKELDLFADVKIITEGISPYVYVTYLNESKNDYLKGLEYRIDKASGLSIGDTITITCLIDKDTARTNGFYYLKDSMEYTITTADKYIDTVEELDKNVIEGFKETLPMLIETETADTTYHMAYMVTGNKMYLYRDNNEKMVNVKLDGVYLAYNNTDYEQEHENYVMVVCSGKIALPKYTTEADPYTYVSASFCFLYPDAILSTDGEFCMSTDEPWDRVVCGTSYDEVMTNVWEQIGKGYTLVEYTE